VQYRYETLTRDDFPMIHSQRAQQWINAGAPYVVVDPSPENARAVAKYAKAGFEGDHIAPCEDGDPVRIMLLH
jgi:aminoglycoside 6'-N-acetyltransferase